MHFALLMRLLENAKLHYVPCIVFLMDGADMEPWSIGHLLTSILEQTPIII